MEGDAVRTRHRQMRLATLIKAGCNVGLNHLGFRRPIFCQLEVTYQCNLKCNTCNVWRVKQEETPHDNLMWRLEEAFKSGVVFFNVTGGEPLLKFDKTFHALALAHKMGVHTSMNTNGLLLKQYIKYLYPHLDVVHTSIDSPIPCEHDKIRGVRGAFTGVYHGIKASRDLVKVGVNMTVAKQNFDQLEAMCELTQIWGVEQFLTPCMVIPTEGVEYSKSRELVIDPKDYVREVRRLKKIYPHIKTTDSYLNFVANGGFNRFPCRAGEMTLNIKPDGSVAHPCGYFCEHRHEGVGAALTCRNRLMSGKYSFCRDCNLSCMYLPSAVLDIKSLPSLVKGYF